MNITQPGWIHKNDKSGDTHFAAHDALVSYLLDFRSSSEDIDTEDFEISSLDGTTHAVLYLKECTLSSEERRETELVGIEDEDEMLELPIGGKFYRQVDIVRFILSVSRDDCDHESGKIVISYQRKLRTVK